MREHDSIPPARLTKWRHASLIHRLNCWEYYFANTQLVAITVRLVYHVIVENLFNCPNPRIVNSLDKLLRLHLDPFFEICNKCSQLCRPGSVQKSKATWDVRCVFGFDFDTLWRSTASRRGGGRHSSHRTSYLLPSLKSARNSLPFCNSLLQRDRSGGKWVVGGAVILNLIVEPIARIKIAFDSIKNFNSNKYKVI